MVRHSPLLYQQIIKAQAPHGLGIYLFIYLFISSCQHLSSYLFSPRRGALIVNSKEDPFRTTTRQVIFFLKQRVPYLKYFLVNYHFPLCQEELF